MGGEELLLKLGLDTKEDKKNISLLKDKLSTINQDKIKGIILEKGMSVVLMENYLTKNKNNGLTM